MRAWPPAGILARQRERGCAGNGIQAEGRGQFHRAGGWNHAPEGRGGGLGMVDELKWRPRDESIPTLRWEKQKGHGAAVTKPVVQAAISVGWDTASE